MSNTRIALCSAALLCVSLSFASFVLADNSVAASLAQPQPDANTNANTNTNYDLDPIVVNYQQYKIGDNLPEQYLDKSYTIVLSNGRNVISRRPKRTPIGPNINANYILITNDSAKIVQAKFFPAANVSVEHGGR